MATARQTCTVPSMLMKGMHHKRSLVTAMVTAGGLFLVRGLSSRNLRGCTVAALSCLVFSKSCYAFAAINRSPSQQKLGTALQMSSSATCPSTFTVAQFPCLNDNYGYLIHDEVTGQTAAIDTPCARTYKQELERRGWKLTHIFNTHQ